jgi:putative acetyltransferase
VSNILIRTIEPRDNATIAGIIRNALTEFGGNKPGTVFTDPTTDHLYELFQVPRSVYYIAEEDDMVLGGAGIYPTQDLPDNTAELVKMYLSPEARGKGLGKLLIERSLDYARQQGYKQVYLESLPELKKAVGIYEKFGFRHLKGPLGNSGHYGCDIWMIKDLD